HRMCFCSRLVFAWRKWSDFLHDLDHASPAFDRVIEMKDKMRSVFEDNIFCQRSLERTAMRLELANHGCTGSAEHADKNMRIFQIGRDVHLINTDKTGLKRHLPRNNAAKFAFEQFVYPEQSMFHL